MRQRAHIVATAARFHGPLILMFALALLAAWPAASGVGMPAGLAFGLAMMLHVLVFGVEAARRALPIWACRALTAIGLTLASVAAGIPRFVYAGQMSEAGLFLVVGAGSALVIVALFGRAPTLRDAES